MKKIFLAIAFLVTGNITAQYASEYESGNKIKLNEQGDKYIHFLLAGQAFFQDYEGNNQNDGFSVKRARFIAYSQINERFLILIHLGASGITDQQLTPGGKNDEIHLLLHEMVLQFKVNNNLYLGGGLNNFGGISRGNGQGTINMLTIDNNRADWTTYGLSDHNSSHVGMFAKGRFGKLNYRLSINDAAVNTFDGNHLTELQPNDEKYLGEAILGKGKYAYSGYFDYQFFDQESNVLPYRVGTYLGAKKVFNIGVGFFNHNDALVKNVNGNLVSGNVNHYAIDAFYDSPIGESGAITAYAKFQNSEMGDNYVYGDVVGNGNQVSGHVGYLIPKAIKEGQNKYKNRLQPYVAYSYRNFTALPKPAEELKVGANWYIDGLNARLGIEYQKSFHAPKNANEVLTIQALIVI